MVIKSLSPHKKKSSVLGNLLGLVAFWQGMGFIALVCLIWAIEVLDLPSAIFGQPSSQIDWFGSSILMGGVIVIGFVIVAHTYLQQKQILKGFISVCSYCKKVHVSETDWEQIEEFISERTLAEFTHGVCPACYKEIMDGLESEESEGAEKGDVDKDSDKPDLRIEHAQ